MSSKSKRGGGRKYPHGYRSLNASGKERIREQLAARVQERIRKAAAAILALGKTPKEEAA